MIDIPVNRKMVELMIGAGIPHCRDLGIEVAEIDLPKLVLKLAYQERLIGDPATGVLHGGVITTLIDTVCGISVQASLARLTTVATLDLRIDYLKPSAPRQDLFASAECYKLTRHIGFVRSIAYNDDADQPVANCVATFMIASSDQPPLPEDVAEEVARLVRE